VVLNLPFAFPVVAELLQFNVGVTRLFTEINTPERRLADKINAWRPVLGDREFTYGWEKIVLRAYISLWVFF
jgi:hypothetical protein